MKIINNYNKSQTLILLITIITLYLPLIKSFVGENTAERNPVIPIDEELSSVSDYIKNAASNLPYTNYTQNTDITYRKVASSNFTGKVDDNFTVSLGSEFNGLNLDKLKIIHDDVILNSTEGYNLNMNISSYVHPNNLFSKFESKKSTNNNNNNNNNKDDDDESPLDCTYINTGFTYDYNTYSNVNFEKVVTFGTISFALFTDRKGIFVMKKDNDSFSFVSLDSYITQLHNTIGKAPSLNHSTDETSFDELWIVNQGHLLGGHLVARDQSKKFHIFNITEEYDGNTNFINAFLHYYSDFSYSEINYSLIERVGFYEDMFIAGSRTDGIFFFKNLDSASDSANSNSTNFNKNFELHKKLTERLSDMIINNNTIYIAIRDVGMKILDLNTLEYTNFEFKHPNLEQFDYLSFPVASSSHFIGLSVKNNPPSITEFFLELNADDEFNPSLNRVYTSSKPIYSDNFVTDFHRFTVFFDKFTNNFIILLRGVPNNLMINSFVIPPIKQDKITFNNTSNPLFVLYDVDEYYPTFLVKNENDYLTLTKLVGLPNQLNCRFNKKGEYSIIFNSGIDCSTSTDGKANSSYCPFVIADHFIIDPARNSSLVAILIILLIIVAIILVFALCIKFRCCRKFCGGGKSGQQPQGDTGNVNYHQAENNHNNSNKEGGEIEINIDEGKENQV